MKQIRDITKIYWFFVFVTITPLLFSLLFQKQREEDFVFVFINAAILLFPLHFIKKNKIYISVTFLLLFIPAFLDFGHIFLYQGRITESIFFIIFDTNPSESFEYLESNISFELVSSCLAYTFISLYFLKKILKIEKNVFKWGKFQYFSVWILFPFIVKLGISNFSMNDTLEAYRRGNHFISMIYFHQGYLEQMKRFKSFASNQNLNLDISRNGDVPEKEIYFLILGESTTSTKMQVYGYTRENTPRLKELNDSNEIHIFRDVVSSDPPGTMANLKKVLTLANTERETSELLGINIINIMKAAGFKTYWVSNQLILGNHDTTTTVFAKQAARTSFTNTTNSISYDKKVLPIIKDYLNEDVDKKFIVIHLIGTHMKYRNRFPSEFEKFVSDEGINKRDFHNKKKIKYINDYDNAIYYHDYILGEIFNIIKENTNSSKGIYLSDHGEEVYDLKNLHGHPFTVNTINMYKIPFFIWGIDQADAENYLKRKYVSDDTIHTMFDLFKINFKDSDISKSIINPNFIEKKRMMGKQEI
jgi:heptose-I-phosphate ethanolaminephosphotransferase